MTSDSTSYQDANANKFPESVEPLGVTRDSISTSTVNTKDPYTMMGVGLFIIHNILRRSLFSIATHARTQLQPPSPDFVHYASFVMKFLEEHHYHEDEIFFPTLQPWIDFSESAHEHEEIARQIAAVNDTIKTAGEPLAKNVETLSASLDEHLMKEEWLVNRFARRIPLDVLEAVETRQQDVIQAENKKSGDLWILCFIIRSMTPGENEVFPPMPWIVKFIMKLVGNWKYSAKLEYTPFL